MKKNEIQLGYCKFEDQTVDIFTNALPTMKFQLQRKTLEIQEHYIKGGECPVNVCKLLFVKSLTIVCFNVIDG